MKPFLLGQKPASLIPCFALSLCAFLAGCSQQTIDSASKDVARDAAIVKRETGPDLKKLGLGARVTAALRANQNLPSTIRVDASETGVFLRGAVKTSEQKKMAEHIARETLSDKFTVQDDLKVSE